MPLLGLTGGIATGKTTVAQEFLRRTSADFFDADACVHALLDADPGVQAQVQEHFNVADEQGKLNRVRLREVVFSDPAKRKLLESILHPEVRRRWLEQAKLSAASGRWFFAEIPLLFETEAESFFDRVIVVACAPETQRHRLQKNRGLTPTLAANIVAAQLDLRSKITNADHLIWNDSTAATMNGQIDLLVGWLRQCYG